MFIPAVNWASRMEGVLRLWDSVFAGGQIRWGHRWYFYPGTGVVVLVEFAGAVARELVHSP